VPTASRSGGYALLDSHCHAWRVWPYSTTVPDPHERGTVAQLLYEMEAHGVEQAAIVCAAIEHNPDNLDYVASACERHPERLHMVGDHDCHWSSTYHLPGSAARLRALDDRYNLVGFTHYVLDDNDGWLRSEEADAVFQVAAERHLIVNLAASPAWQADLRGIASRYPMVPVLCNTLGGIHAELGVDSAELTEVVASAAIANIYLKAAGFHYCTEFGWDYPWTGVVGMFEKIFEAYGPRRLCWGSDFPASKRFTTYGQALEVVRGHCPFMTADDLRLVLGENLRGLLATAQASG
jgi:L-fuconolactonase